MYILTGTQKQQNKQTKKKKLDTERYYLSYILDILYFADTKVRGPRTLNEHPSRTKHSHTVV